MAASSIVRHVAASIACASAFYVAGCSDTAITPPARTSSDGASLSQSPDIIGATGRHVFHTKQWFDANNAAGNGHGHGGGGGGSTNNGITYHGGPVLQSGTNVVAVYWASAPIYVGGPSAGSHSTSNAGDQSLVGSFLRTLGGSAYFNINSSYTDGAGAAIANVVNYAGYWANNANVPANGQNVSDADMLAMLSSGFQSGALSYDANTLYAIFTAGTVNLGGGFGSQYCAYHWYGTVNTQSGSKTVRYAAMPYDHAYPGSCDVIGTRAANGNVDPGADAEVNTLAHETEETTTDEFGTAWFDTRGYENADKCAWTFGSTFTSPAGGIANITLGGKSYLIQQNWVNANGGGCSMHWP